MVPGLESVICHSRTAREAGKCKGAHRFLLITDCPMTSFTEILMERGNQMGLDKRFILEECKGDLQQV